MIVYVIQSSHARLLRVLLVSQGTITNISWALLQHFAFFHFHHALRLSTVYPLVKFILISVGKISAHLLNPSLFFMPCRSSYSRLYSIVYFFLLLLLSSSLYLLAFASVCCACKKYCDTYSVMHCAFGD